MNKKVKKLAEFCLLSLICLVSPFGLFSSRAAEPPIYSSTNYKMELLGIGQEILLSSIIDSIPPTITSGPTVTDVSSGSMTAALIVWTTNKNSSSIVLYGPTTAYGSDFGNTSELVTSHSVTVPGLVAGQTYHFKVRSVDSVGNIGESADGTFVVGDVSPPTISGVTIAAVESSYILVKWTTDEASISIVEYGKTTDYGTEVGSSKEEYVTSHTVKISGLDRGTTYYFRVKSQDAAGNVAYSSGLSATTSTSSSISNVQITDITLNSAVVSWDTNQSATTEMVYGKTTSYGMSYADSSLTKSHTVRLTNLDSGTVYHFQIRGTDSAGTGLASDDYQFETVILPLIFNVRVEGITEKTAIIRWESTSKIDELIEYEAIRSSIEDVELLTKMTSGSVDLVTDHAHKLKNLDADTTYCFRIFGKDAFGNQATSSTYEFTTGIDKVSPVISNIRTDTALDLGSRDSVQVLVSYSTDEPASGYIKYGQGAAGPYNMKSIVDDSFTNAKVIVLPKLVPGSSYHFKIVATDKSGNEAESDDNLVLAPQIGLTLLELILGRLGEAFGWMGKL